MSLRRKTICNALVRFANGAFFQGPTAHPLPHDPRLSLAIRRRPPQSYAARHMPPHHRLPPPAAGRSPRTAPASAARGNSEIGQQ